jgi:hypothetical protein
MLQKLELQVHMGYMQVICISCILHKCDLIYYTSLNIYKSRSVVGVQQRFGHEFCLEGVQEYHPVTVF